MFAKRAAPPMAIVVCSLMLAAPASAQHASGAPRQTATTAGDNERRHDGESAHPAPDSSHHRMLYAMMKDMSAEMKRMTDQMSQGEPTSEQRKQMAQRMGRMSILMRRMSGLEARHAMSEPKMEKAMDQMRQEMDAMTRGPAMKREAK